MVLALLGEYPRVPRAFQSHSDLWDSLGPLFLTAEDNLNPGIFLQLANSMQCWHHWLRTTRISCVKAEVGYAG